MGWDYRRDGDIAEGRFEPLWQVRIEKNCLCRGRKCQRTAFGWQHNRFAQNEWATRGIGFDGDATFDDAYYVTAVVAADCLRLIEMPAVANELVAFQKALDVRLIGGLWLLRRDWARVASTSGASTAPPRTTANTANRAGFRRRVPG